MYYICISFKMGNRKNPIVFNFLKQDLTEVKQFKMSDETEAYQWGEVVKTTGHAQWKKGVTLDTTKKRQTKEEGWSKTKLHTHKTSPPHWASVPGRKKKNLRGQFDHKISTKKKDNCTISPWNSPSQKGNAQFIVCLFFSPNRQNSS